MILTSDLHWHLSTTAGTTGNALPSTPNASLGKNVATTQIVDATLSNLFDEITGPENAAMEAEFRLMFFRNAHATLPLTNPVAWLETEIIGGALAAISFDTTGVTNLGLVGTQAKTIVDENTPPASQTFLAPTSKVTGIALGSPIGAGQVVGVWVRRTAQNTVAQALDGVTVRCEGDTAQ